MFYLYHFKDKHTKLNSMNSFSIDIFILQYSNEFTLSLLMMTQEAFEGSADLDQTAVWSLIFYLHCPHFHSSL